MQIPEDAKTVTAEGADLRSAVALAAEQLSVHPSQVDHKLDLSHFRSSIGTSVAKNTVKVVAWAVDRPISEEAPKPKARRSERDDDGEEKRERRARGKKSDRSERRDRGERSERRDRGERRERRGPADGETEASAFAASWFEVVLKHMDVEAEIVATGDDERVHVAIKADKAGRVVGKRGATLRSIRHLLGLAIERQFGERVIDVDVGDDRPREEREDRGERSERRSRDRRGGRASQKRSRGGRSDSALPEEKLRALARRAAERAKETGQTITINLKLNSYDRRLVHLEVSEVDGVDSQSEEREEDGEIVKYVQVIPVD